MRNKRDDITLKLVQSAMFCALVFVATMISIPTPSVGNVNLGDSMLIVCACYFGGIYSIIACALGATLSDLLGGYAIYAPGTFIIKAIMVSIILLLRDFVFKSEKIISIILSAVVAELFMVIGYFIYESLILGYGRGAIVNTPFNIVQAIMNITLSGTLYPFLKKSGMYKDF